MAVLPASDIQCVDMTSPSATAVYDAELGPHIIDETRHIGTKARHSEY